MPLVVKRYAEALIEIAEQGGMIPEYEEELKAIADTYRSSPELRDFLLSPEIKVQVKKAAVQAMFTGKVRTELVSFQLLLLDKGRIKHVQGIVTEFFRMASHKRNILHMTIASATPLEDEQVQRIKEKYRSLYGAVDVIVKLAIDQTLLGGVKVVIGDKVFDGSVKSRLDALKELIVEN
jgi:F-type H+-transporting ATPase subunit delta